MNGITMKAVLDVEPLLYDIDSTRWFGVKVGRLVARLRPERDGCSLIRWDWRAYGCLAQAFVRDVKDDGLIFGASLWQVGTRHLLYVGAKNGAPHLALGFCWLSRERP